MAYGALAALDDRPRPGKEPTITPEAKAWLVSLACDKAKEHGYPHELWTTRLLARHARERGPAAGHQCLARLAQGTVCKLLGQEEIKPHKVRYYLERRDAEFEPKMAEVLCVYREVQVLKKARTALGIIDLDFRILVVAEGETRSPKPLIKRRQYQSARQVCVAERQGVGVTAGQKPHLRAASEGPLASRPRPGNPADRCDDGFSTAWREINEQPGNPAPRLVRCIVGRTPRDRGRNSERQGLPLLDGRRSRRTPRMRKSTVSVPMMCSPQSLPGLSSPRSGTPTRWTMSPTHTRPSNRASRPAPSC